MRCVNVFARNRRVFYHTQVCRFVFLAPLPVNNIFRCSFHFIRSTVAPLAFIFTLMFRESNISLSVFGYRKLARVFVCFNFSSCFFPATLSRIEPTIIRSKNLQFFFCLVFYSYMVGGGMRKNTKSSITVYINIYRIDCLQCLCVRRCLSIE